MHSGLAFGGKKNKSMFGQKTWVTLLVGQRNSRMLDSCACWNLS